MIKKNWAYVQSIKGNVKLTEECNRKGIQANLLLFQFYLFIHNLLVVNYKTCNNKKTKSTTAVDPRQLNLKENISLIKNYCITISIQKISSIHKFILKIQQIFGSHELKDYGHFSPQPPKHNGLYVLLS